MTQSLYIATTDPACGKSSVLLGVAELLSHQVNRLAIFRPVLRGFTDPDNDTELIRTRYCPSLPYEALYAVMHDEAIELTTDGDADRLLELIFEKHKKLERHCDFILCEGTDFSGLGSTFEFDFNARIANHLGASVLMVGHGRGRSPEDVVASLRVAHEEFAEEKCTIAAAFANRIAPDDVEEVRACIARGWSHDYPVYVLPELPELAAPTVREIIDSLGAHPLYELNDDHMLREVHGYKIAAMTLPNFLDHVVPQALIITPGDRSDIILGSLSSIESTNYPPIGGIILSGGTGPATQVKRLLDGLSHPPVPILQVDTDTYTTALAVSRIRGLITPDNPRKIATALGMFESCVDLEELERQIEVTRSTSVTPLRFEYTLVERAKRGTRHIVLPEGMEERILIAAEIIARRGIVDLTLLGNEEKIRAKITDLGLDLQAVKIINPSRSPLRARFAASFQKLRRHKNVTLDMALDMMLDETYFGTMMVQEGLADGMVSGATHTTANTIRPAFEIIKTRPGTALVSSVFFICLEDRVLVFGDCAINPNPNPQQLADIATSSADTASLFGILPRVAMLSYSTGESGTGEDVELVQEATRIAQRARPDLLIEGPIQYDAAIDARVAEKKLPGSNVAGRATVFIFPDLNTGNNTYKAVQQSTDALAIGPVLQGLRKPVNDLSRGCTVSDIVNTIAITAVQAEMMEVPAR